MFACSGHRLEVTRLLAMAGDIMSYGVGIIHVVSGEKKKTAKGCPGYGLCCGGLYGLYGWYACGEIGRGSADVRACAGGGESSYLWW